MRDYSTFTTFAGLFKIFWGSSTKLVAAFIGTNSSSSSSSSCSYSIAFNWLMSSILSLNFTVLCLALLDIFLSSKFYFDLCGGWYPFFGTCFCFYIAFSWFCTFSLSSFTLASRAVILLSFLYTATFTSFADFS